MGKVSYLPLIAMFCVILFTGTVLADTGPKRSIDIEFVNPPSEPYYAALLMPGSYHLDMDRDRNTRIPDEAAWVREIFYEYEEDGYVLFYYAGSYSSITASDQIEDEGKLSFGYMVPSTFKVMVVTQSGEVSVSNEITARAFYSECEYDYSANTLKEVNFEKNTLLKLAVESFFYCGITLVVEGLVLLCFGLFRKKNLPRFLIVNLITQVLLFGFNCTCRLIEPLWKMYFFIWIIVEVLIAVIEAVLYSKKLIRKDGSVSVKRNIFYAIIANLISATIDIPVILVALFMR